MTRREFEDVEIAIVDNYDSFSHNLEQYVGEFANVTIDRYEKPPESDGIVFSPGPGRPEDFPVMYDILDQESEDVPVLGVCLGHQAICDFYGGSVGYAGEVVHGKTSEIDHRGTGVFENLPNPMEVGRYHSLVVDEVPRSLEVTAEGAGEVMSVEHKEKPIYGVQFHPESILTPAGKDLVKNFVRISMEHR